MGNMAGSTCGVFNLFFEFFIWYILQSMKPNLIKLDKNDSIKFFPAVLQGSETYHFTDVSLYSTTPVDQSLWTANAIVQVLGKKPSWIIDANACIGGNTWSFAQFSEVTAIELEPIHVRALQHNMDIITKSKIKPPLQHIDIIEGNCVDVLRELFDPRAKPPEFYASIETPAAIHKFPDVVFVDPPWGGIDYKKEKNIILSYRHGRDQIPLHQLLVELINKERKYIAKHPRPSVLYVAKLPYNYDFSTLKICNNTQVINATDILDIPLYSLVFMSDGNLGPIDKPQFPRLGYKKMRITKI